MEKVANCTPYSQGFQVLRYLFNILKLNNAMYMPRVPSLIIPLTTCCAIYFLNNLLFKTKDLNSKKMMWNHAKSETVPPIIRRV